MRKKELVKALAYDIGGANTKAALIHTKNGEVLSVHVAVEYFPIWKKPEKLSNVLTALKRRLITGKVDAIGITMTAELSDAYQTKREGVHQIVSSVDKTFQNFPIFILNTDAELCSSDFAKKNPLRVAAANWAATGWLVAQNLKNAVVIDVGSTSTSIIPIINGQIAAEGKTDLAKLICGELIYTGSLRTNVAAIVQSIPLKNGVSGVSSELFAQSADAHLILGNITEAEYTSETADGRGKSMSESIARLSRVVCADTEMLSTQEIIDMASYVYKQQIMQILHGLTKVYTKTKKQTTDKVPIIVTGMGKKILARKAAEQIDADAIIDLETILHKQAALATPAVGLALMTANKLTGESSTWRQ